jgi:hypothetical protein
MSDSHQRLSWCRDPQHLPCCNSRAIGENLSAALWRDVVAAGTTDRDPPTIKVFTGQLFPVPNGLSIRQDGSTSTVLWG